MQDVSGPECMKILLDHMHATTCSHLTRSSSTPGSKHLSSKKDGLLSHSPGSIHLGIRLGRRDCVWLMKEKCSQTGWSIILTWGMKGWVVPVLEQIPTLPGCRWWRCLWQRKRLGQSVPLLCGQDCARSCLLLSVRDTYPSGIVFFFTMLKAGAGRAGDSGESGHCSKGERTAQLTRC